MTHRLGGLLLAVLLYLPIAGWLIAAQGWSATTLLVAIVATALAALGLVLLLWLVVLPLVNAGIATLEVADDLASAFKRRR